MTTYALLLGGLVVYSGSYDPKQLSQALMSAGGPSVSFPGNPPAQLPTALGNALLVTVGDSPPTYNPITQQLVAGPLTIAGQTVSTTYSVASLPPNQIAQNSLALGCAVSSFSTPALNATYYTDDSHNMELLTECSYFTSFGTFTNGSSTLIWPVVGGSITLTGGSQLQNLAKGLGAYVAAWKQYGDGLISTPPTQPISIP